MSIIIEMDMATKVQTLDEAVYISCGANTFGKSMHLTILIIRQTVLFNFG